MEVTLRHLANRIKMDRKFLEEHLENKDMLERRLNQTKELIVERVVKDYAD